MIEETNTSGAMQRDYISGVYPEQGRRAGRRVAWRDSSNNVYYYFADAIGSTRAVTNATGTKCFDAEYARRSGDAIMPSSFCCAAPAENEVWRDV